MSPRDIGNVDACADTDDDLPSHNLFTSRSIRIGGKAWRFVGTGEIGHRRIRACGERSHGKRREPR